ncbi:hypothetical protein [Janthinobacterium sp. J1-1]|uniref:hypothetical protein n=1 Tax=Janthinobacterium sp. J1-1 TaxID=3065910 RepID=UPI0028115FDB|nr:hypothetical protein [Janthinobacterium sp. J1-1]
MNNLLLENVALISDVVASLGETINEQAQSVAALEARLEARSALPDLFSLALFNQLSSTFPELPDELLRVLRNFSEQPEISSEWKETATALIKIVETNTNNGEPDQSARNLTLVYSSEKT